ncbi:hypothetical protein ACSSVY_004494 [Roseovarius sp. MBR-51]
MSNQTRLREAQLTLDNLTWTNWNVLTFGALQSFRVLCGVIVDPVAPNLRYRIAWFLHSHSSNLSSQTRSVLGMPAIGALTNKSSLVYYRNMIERLRNSPMVSKSVWSSKRRSGRALSRSLTRTDTKKGEPWSHGSPFVSDRLFSRADQATSKSPAPASCDCSLLSMNGMIEKVCPPRCSSFCTALTRRSPSGVLISSDR